MSKYDFKKMSFDRDCSIESISDHSKVIDAFNWSITTQDVFFWKNVYENGHTEESLKILVDMLLHYDGWKETKPKYHSYISINFEDTPYYYIIEEWPDSSFINSARKEVERIRKSKCEEKEVAPPDTVNSPTHYKSEGVIECIEAIKASMSPEEFKGYLKGNCIKYIWRYTYKNGLEDLKKAEVYLGWLREEVENE